MAINSSVFAQEQSASKKDFSEILSVRGYVKDLRTVSFRNLDSINLDNLIHNRINFRYYISDNITFALESRNRIFYGESVKANPNYGDLFDVDRGVVDMSYLLVNENSLVFHSIIDRLWFNYSHEKFDLRIGRQRVNWGVNLVWNPNDIFNAYSFVDFDYEERPGSDAIRFEYYLTNSSSIETVFSMGDEFESTTFGAMYKFNKWAYDFQLLVGGSSGQFETDDLIAGLGWAGNIKNAGFKGEVSWFYPISTFTNQIEGIWSATLAVDYAFPNSLYLNGSFLLNTKHEPVRSENGLLNFYSTDLSAKNLMPSEYSLFAQTSYTFSPIVTGSLSAIYGVDLKLLFVNPVIGISIANNWELSLVGQLAYAPSSTEDFTNQGNGIFIRTKWSFSN